MSSPAARARGWRTTARAARPDLLGLTLAVAAALCGCDRFGDGHLPDTTPPGRSGAATITIVPAAGPSAGTAFPVQLEALFPAGASPPSRVCVAVSASPGRLTFPFDPACPTSADGGDSATGNVDAAAAPVDGGAGGLIRSLACAGVQMPAGQRPYALALAAYLPAGAETSASLFASLYGQESCTGSPVAEVGIVVNIPGAAPPAADAGEAGADATADAPLEAPDAGAADEDAP